MNEAQLQARLRADFILPTEERHWRKIHGSRFQAGLPDLLVATPRGAAMVELKALKPGQRTWTFNRLCRELLTGPQRMELEAIWRVCGPLRAVVVMGWEDPLGFQWVVSSTPRCFNYAYTVRPSDIETYEELRGVQVDGHFRYARLDALADAADIFGI